VKKVKLLNKLFILKSKTKLSSFRKTVEEGVM